jgi:hypothetical protein
MSNPEKPSLINPASSIVLPAHGQETVPAVQPTAITAGAKLRAHLALTGLCGLADTALTQKALASQPDGINAHVRPETRH